MAQILISSADPLQAERWEAVLVQQHDASRLPDLQSVHAYLLDTPGTVLVVDANLLKSGSSALTELARSRLKILIIGRHWSDQQQIDALIAGCDGYCEAEAAETMLLKAVNRLLKGDVWIQRHLVPHVIRTLAEQNNNTQPPPTPPNGESGKKLALLSSRELEVASLIRAGENNKKIAAKLNISERTVKAHLTSIFNKLEIHDRLHLALFLKETASSDWLTSQLD
ncbi:MAG: response regulator transcription factor [Gammaproteobacteria bacterium]